MKGYEDVWEAFHKCSAAWAFRFCTLLTGKGGKAQTSQQGDAGYLQNILF